MCIGISSEQKRRSDVRWTFGATCGVSQTAIYCPAWSPSTPPSSGAELQQNLHSIIPDVFLERRALLRLALAWVLRWKDPMLPIFMNKVFKVWTLWSAAALCIIIITLMSKTIAASNATLDIYMKVVSKQVMTTRRLMTVCNVNESFALFQMVMLSHHRRSQKGKAPHLGQILILELGMWGWFVDIHISNLIITQSRNVSRFFWLIWST